VKYSKYGTAREVEDRVDDLKIALRSRKIKRVVTAVICIESILV
jgi:hypothetical protein